MMQIIKLHMQDSLVISSFTGLHYCVLVIIYYLFSMSHGNTAVHIKGDLGKSLHTVCMCRTGLCVCVCGMCHSPHWCQTSGISCRLSSLFDQHADEKPAAAYFLSALRDKGDSWYHSYLKFSCSNPSEIAKTIPFYSERSCKLFIQIYMCV